MGVTVTAKGQTSNSQSITKQKPSRLVYFNVSGAPNGIGPLQTPVNGNVVNLAGQVLKSNQCGVYRNYAFDLVDQNGAGISATYSFTESFTNYVGPVGTPSPQTYSITPNSLLNDIQYFGKTYPNCLTTNQNEVMDQHFSVTIGGTPINLSTIIHISRGNFSGTLEVNETVTTQ